MNTATTPTSSPPAVLMIYTGGTIGMIENSHGVLEPFDFNYIEQHVPELQRFGYTINTISFDRALDSSEIGPQRWIEIAQVISANYEAYDGFVVLHGTDTMAFTASALSFMMEGLRKPVVLTGSQLPIGKLRTDGKENLITAIEIAASKDESGASCVQEVCVFFENFLYRGNRSMKVSAELFDAFASPNYPPLARVGIDIEYNSKVALCRPDTPFSLKLGFDTNVVVLKLFPGISRQVVESVLRTEGLRGVVLETFGSGNAPCYTWFLNALREAVAKGVVIVNVTQCMKGNVQMHRYEMGRRLLEVGVLSGYDSTLESAVAKLMYLLGSELSISEVKFLMNTSIRGEITTSRSSESSLSLER